MSLFSILHIGTSGVRAAEAGVQTTSDNIVNASTPGYHVRRTRQTPGITTRRDGHPLGTGVEVGSVLRSANEVLSERVRLASAGASGAEVRAEVLSRAAAVVGSLGEESLTGVLDALMTSFDALATNPESTAARRQVLNAAGNFVSEMNRYAAEVAGLQSGIDAEVQGEVDRINVILDELAQLNALALSTDPTSLDRRDALLAELSEHLDVRTVIDANQKAQVYLRATGDSLVLGRRSSPLGTTIGANGRLSVEVATASGPIDITGSLATGELGGLIQARDADLATLVTDLDTVTFDIATAVNTLHAAGFGTDGVTGRNLFTVGAAAAGSAASIAVDAAVVGNPAAVAAATDPLLVPGDNRNALALAQLRDTAVSGGATGQDALRQALASFGTRAVDATRAAETRGATHTQLAALEQELAGVSIDEELTHLIEYQQAYAAAARVIQTADEMMTELLALKR